MNVVSFFFCFVIRIVDLVIRAFDRFCSRVTKICDEDDRLHQRQKASHSGNGRRNDPRKWLLWLLGVLVAVIYIWVVFINEENDDGVAKRRKIGGGGKLGFVNVKAG